MKQTEKFAYGDRVIEYVIDFPESFDGNRKYPVMFYIHGYGFTKRNINELSADCPLRRERLPEDLDFILVAPLCNDITWIKHFEALRRFIEYIEEKPYCNKSKVYLSGSSMGGYTSWMLLHTNSELFTAAVICCGGGQYWAAGVENAFTVPIMAVHGRQDKAVLCRESEILAEKINEHGGSCKLIIHEDLAHDVWTRTFTNPETYYWLNSFSK